MDCNHDFKKLTKTKSPIIEWCEHCGSIRKSFFETTPQSFIEKPTILDNLTTADFDDETSNMIHKTIIPLLENHGWTHFDDTALEQKIDDKNVILVIYPKFISYTTTTGFSTKHTVLEIWYKCRMSIDHKQIQPVTNQLLESFKKFSIKPFKDEDAFRSYFSLKPYKDYSDIAFFLNPHHLNGKWDNHSIENA